MQKTYLPNYNLHETLLGGQAFNWEKIGDTYYGNFQDKIVSLKYIDDHLYWNITPYMDDFGFIAKYLRLNVDYHGIVQKISIDDHIRTAIESHPNIRLLDQEFEQTILSFVVSSNKNIPAIRRSIKLLSERYGRRININTHTFYTFPTSKSLADASLDDLKQTGIGYRAPYLKRTAQLIVETNLPKKIKELDEQNSRNLLLTLPGVGPKVADCALVYSLSFVNVTPLDIWGQRFLTKLYGLDPKLKYEDMRKWYQNYFNGLAGWAGQFLFEYVRSAGIK